MIIKRWIQLNCCFVKIAAVVRLCVGLCACAVELFSSTFFLSSFLNLNCFWQNKYFLLGFGWFRFSSCKIFQLSFGIFIVNNQLVDGFLISNTWKVKDTDKCEHRQNMEDKRNEKKNNRIISNNWPTEESVYARTSATLHNIHRGGDSRTFSCAHLSINCGISSTENIYRTLLC